MTYYNEHDPKAAAWLRELVANGIIPGGHIDTRSIADVRADDLVGFSQCHFFAGVGGWPYALRLAGWPDDRPVWTGSCPCQPFSAAGKQRGTDDERHLWPEFRRLIAECRPPTVFGEQVASVLGRQWLAGVRANLEALGYAVGAADLCAASVGAPHIRQRLYWVADASCPRLRGVGGRGGIGEGDAGAHSDDHYERFGGVGDTESGGCGKLWNETFQGSCGHSIGASWARFEIIQCRDGKARRFEPGSFPLAHGVPGRVGLLRGYGNAIVPQVAAEFVRSFCESVTPAKP